MDTARPGGPRAAAREDPRPLRALLALCAALYLNALPGMLFWDNELLILKNSFLRSWRFVPQILTSSLFAGAGEATNYYRPVPMLLLLIQYQLWGESPLGYHAVSILLHLANAALVFFCARRVLGPGRGALAAAAVFALHPLQNETVNYVDHQEGMLAVLFGLGAFLLRERGRRWPSLACWALCLLSKEEGVVFFPVLCLYELGRGREPGAWSLRWARERRPVEAARDLAARLRRLWPYAALLAAYAASRLTVFNFLHLPLAQFGAQKGAYAALGRRVLTFAEALRAYLRLLLWPTGLHFDRDIEPVASYFDRAAWGAGALDAAALLGLWAASPGPGRFGLLWFALGLLPFCGLVPFNNILAEHFLYLPLAGLSLTVGALWQAREPRGSRSRLAAAAAAGLVGSFWSVQILRRNRDWQSPSAIYFTTLAGNPRSYRAANNLGVEYFRDGRLELARESFEQALRVRPSYAPALNNVGAVLENQGRAEEALLWYDRSLAADAAYVQARKNKAGLLLRLGRHAEAARAAQAALNYHPHYAEALEILGTACFHLKEFARARDAFERAAAIRPSPAASHNLAETYRALGMPREAEAAERSP